MPITSGMTVVFQVAAGPRLGFGHLVRCRSLARALGVPPRVWVRGSAATRAAAGALGCDVLPTALSLGDVAPSVLVVDDPSPVAAAAAVRRARACGVLACTIHDAGRTRVGADLVVDGSVGIAPRRVGHTLLLGPAFAVLDPGVRARRRAWRASRRRRVCIALGGGAQVFSLVPRLVEALARRAPGLHIRVARGFVARTGLPTLTVGQWLAPQRLGAALAAADVAIVAGGVTAYEACAVGTPLVAVAVTPAQQPTVNALEQLGAAVDGGLLRSRASAIRIAERAVQLLDAPAAQRRLSAAGRGLIDGDGASRVAAALRALVAQAQTRNGAVHAA